jgi:hypothetical protein
VITSLSISELLKRFDTLKIYVDETREHHDGTKVLILRTHLPEIPYGHKKPTWATLVISQNQTEIEREEIDTVLRHLCHGSTFLFGDELERELLPTNDREREIAHYIDAAVAAHDGGDWNPEQIVADVKKQLSFQCDDKDMEAHYLEFCATYRRPGMSQADFEKEEEEQD